MGAHASPAAVRATIWHRLILLLILLSSAVVSSVGAAASETLMKFKSSLSASNWKGVANWDASTSPCASGAGDTNWNGVLCHNGNVIGLQLEGMGLKGQIDLRPLTSLTQLRTLSFMNNELEGPMPDVNDLSNLMSLFLSNNNFSGPIPDDAFVGLLALRKVHLANNNFTGKIPASLASAPKLFELSLAYNQFDGTLPDFHPSLTSLNVSNNQLQGPIPPILSAMDPNSFSGNKLLCGKPLASSCDLPMTPAPTPNFAPNTSPADEEQSPTESPIEAPVFSGKTPLATAVIVIAIVVSVAAIVILLMVCRRSGRRQNKAELDPFMSVYDGNTFKTPYRSDSNYFTTTENNTVVGEQAAEAKKGEQQQQAGKLSFVRNDRLRFDLQDLLRASAEVLGNGGFGSSYKAVLMDSQAVVVKRFKQMTGAGREEFHEYMRRIGRLHHPNLLPLVAYYYRKEEKLLVFDFVHNGSLASHLRPAGSRSNSGRSSSSRRRLDCAAVLKIIKGVAKGLEYLHSELPGQLIPHGNLKSSNVLLDHTMQPLLMDYGLVPVVNPEKASQLMLAYKSPEYARQSRITKKTDVWCLGILILEVLTGKFFQSNFLSQGSPAYGSNLADWIATISSRTRNDPEEVVMAQILDERIVGGTPSSEESKKMVNLLKIGVACCEEDLETRLDLKKAVQKIQSL